MPKEVLKWTLRDIVLRKRDWLTRQISSRQAGIQLKINSLRYNLITFLPFSLLNQFRRYANIYFLVIAIIQSISIISPLNPFSAIAPLVFVLGLSMLREG